MEKEDVLIDIVENAVNDAMFAHKHNFKMYEYLIHNNLTCLLYTSDAADE